MINLRITEPQFDQLYPDLVGLYSHFDEPPPAGISDQEFEDKYLCSKLWRLNNLYSITDKAGEKITFRMNYAQHVAYAASRQHPRIIILKSRQQGISTLWLVSFCDDAMFCPYLNVGLMAQGNDEASTLLERVKFLWDNLNDNVKKFLNIKLTKDNTKEFEFSNNSTIFIRVSFRSATLQRLHISELGKIANEHPKRAKETKTGTLQALAKGNTGVIESTAEGKNMFKDEWDKAIAAESSGQMAPKDFKPVFLSWINDPDCTLDIPQAIDSETAKYFRKLEGKLGVRLRNDQKWFWISQHRELEEDIYQEYPAYPEEAFLAGKDGSFFGRLYNEHVVSKGRLQQNLYDKNLYTDFFFDLGVDDYTVYAGVQWYRGTYRIICDYWNSGYGIEHYLDHILDSGVEVRDIVLPHDGGNRTTATQGSHDAKSTEDIANEWIRKNELNWNVRVLTKIGLLDGVAAARRIIPNLYVDATCAYMQSCFLNYSKRWDDKLSMWMKIEKHDEYSHGGSVIRYIGSGVRESEEINRSKMAIPDHYRRRHTPSGFDL